MNKTMQIWRAYENGINNPYLVMRVCDEVGLPFYAACAMLMKESAGGDNVFGHDPTIYRGAGRVTKRKYLAYRKERDATGKMQGVGPCQLTWWEFQDQADALGGCWKPANNMRVGFGLLKKYRENGNRTWEYVGTKYNGGADYGRDYAKVVELWRKLLA